MTRRTTFLLACFLLLIPAILAEPYLWEEGETVVLQTNATHGFVIEILTITESKALIEVNGMRARAISEREWRHYPDKSQIFVTTILQQEGGKDLVETYVVPGTPQELRLDGVEELDETTVAVREAENQTADIREMKKIVQENISTTPDTQTHSTAWQRFISWLSALF